MHRVDLDVPGPGTYDPQSVGQPRCVKIQPLASNRVPKAQVLPELIETARSNIRSMPRMDVEAVCNRAFQVPPSGAYDVPSTFDSHASPFSRSPRISLNNSPRGSRLLFTVDLAERARIPGPGVYDLSAYRSIAGRDRSTRPKLDLERKNYWIPLPAIPHSARR